MFNVTSKFGSIKLASQESLASNYSDEKLATCISDILFEKYESAKEDGSLLFDADTQQYYRPSGINQPHTKHSIIYDWHSATSTQIHFVKELYNRLQRAEQIGSQPFLYRNDKNNVEQGVNEYTYFQLDDNYFVKLIKIYAKDTDKYKFLLSLELTSEPHPAELLDMETTAETNIRKQEYKRNAYGSIPKQESQGAQSFKKKPALA